ncbi:hypothetical protein [Rhodonellum sp.]|uniref:hypothetical protein n=1 Tax=Rhodonellum sp. TaxID=2231180 RepID=UPI00271C7560|nr:hypothetical protein [Rhodonellum sp.]MDO9551546.1 hypothetical protein [Rhodonellum sp.]
MIPAISSQGNKQPYREVLMKWLRVISPLLEVPVSIDKSYQFYLDAYPKPNSKSFAVVSELSQGDRKLGDIWTKRPTLSFFSKLHRLLWHLSAVLPVLIYIFYKGKKFGLVELQVIVGYSLYKNFLKKHQSLIPIIISDITPTAHMLWAATSSLNRDVFWWQDDYHHMDGFSSENYLPHPCTLAAVLNQGGLDTVLKKNRFARIYVRPQTEVLPFKSTPFIPRVGIATNAFFEANTEQIRILIKIQESLGADLFKIRLHPNSKLTSKSFPEDLIVVAAADETIEEFSNSIDIAIVGNSAVQLKLLCAGLPVVHLAGLDQHGFDVYGYCQKGFCYGLDSIEALNSEIILQFYNSTGIAERLYNYVNVRNRNDLFLLDKFESVN